MTLHQANEMTALLEQLQKLHEAFDDLAQELRQIREQHEADNAGEEWKEAQ